MERKIFLCTFLFLLVACHVTTASENKGLVARTLSTLRSYYDAVAQWAQECDLQASVKNTFREARKMAQCIGSKETVSSAIQYAIANLRGNHEQKRRILCQLTETVVPCLQSIYENGFRCLNSSSEITSWDTFARNANGVLEYVCHPSPERLIALNESQSLTCIDNLDVIPCITEHLSANDVVKYLSNADQIKCKKQDLIYDCLMNQLSHCEDDEAHDTVNNVVEKLFHTPCNNAAPLGYFTSWLFVSLITLIARNSYDF